MAAGIKLENEVPVVWIHLSLLPTFKVHFSVPVRVEYLDNPLHQRVLLELRQRHELLHAEGARVIKVELLEPLP